jgi:hypothetical protein
MIRAFKAVVLIFFILFLLPAAVHIGLSFADVQSRPDADTSNSRIIPEAIIVPRHVS